MTNGSRLRTSLDLDEFKHVMISRVFDFPLKLYFVYYDSGNSFPITQSRILKNHRVATLLKGFKVKMGILRHLKMLPPQYIEDWDGTYEDGHIILVDLYGDWFPARGKYKAKFESTELISTTDKLIEDEEDFETEVSYLYEKNLTLINLIDKSVMGNVASNLNKFHYKVRSKVGNAGSFLKAAVYSEAKDALLITFKVNPTWSNKAKNKKAAEAGVKVMPKNQIPKITSGEGTPHLDSKFSKHYTVYLYFGMISSVLSEKEMKDFLEPTKGSQRMGALKKIVKQCPIKVHSNDMSFYWQGVWENLDEFGFSLFPFNGTHGKGVWSRRHKGESPAIYLTKHLLEVLGVLPFWYNTLNRILRIDYDPKKKAAEKKAEKERLAKEKAAAKAAEEEKKAAEKAKADAEAQKVADEKAKADAEEKAAKEKELANDMKKRAAAEKNKKAVPVKDIKKTQEKPK